MVEDGGRGVKREVVVGDVTNVCRKWVVPTWWWLNMSGGGGKRVVVVENGGLGVKRVVMVSNVVENGWC